MWFKWLLIGLWVLSAVSNILLIGKPRQPMSHGMAALQVVLCGLCVWGLLVNWGK